MKSEKKAINWEFFIIMGTLFMKYKRFFIFLFITFLIGIFQIQNILFSQDADSENASDKDTTTNDTADEDDVTPFDYEKAEDKTLIYDEFSEVYEEYKQKTEISFEDLNLLEQIEMGYYYSLTEKYIKQLRAEISSPSEKSDATYALSIITLIEEETDPQKSLDVLLKAIEMTPYIETVYIRRYAALALGEFRDSRVAVALRETLKRRYLSNTDGKYNPQIEYYEKDEKRWTVSPKRDIDTYEKDEKRWVRIPEDLYVRYYALASLMRIGDVSASKDIANVLKEKKEPRVLRRLAAIALGYLLDESVYGTLVNVFKDLEQDKLIIRNIAWALGEYGKLGYNEIPDIEDKYRMVVQPMHTLLKLIYDKQPDTVLNAYISLENLLDTDENAETDAIINDTIKKLKKTIENKKYKTFINTLYEADHTNVDREAEKLINDFILGLEEIKSAVTSKILIKYIKEFLLKINQPKNYMFPKKVILRSEVDKIINLLEQKKKILDEINVSSSKRDRLKNLFTNAYKSLELIDDDDDALKQSEVYKQAVVALKRYEMKNNENISSNEPIKYLEELTTMYEKAIKSLDNFYHIYARREAAEAIGKIYKNTYEEYAQLYKQLKKSEDEISAILKSVINDRKTIAHLNKSLRAKEYLDYFTRQVNYNDIVQNTESYLETIDESLSALMKYGRNYYLYPIHDKYEVVEEKIDEIKTYSREPAYLKENLEELYTEKDLKEILTKSALESLYDKRNSFKEYKDNNEILIITKEPEALGKEKKEIVGTITEEGYEVDETENEVKYIKVKKLAVADDEKEEEKLYLRQINNITIYRIPEELLNEKIIVLGEFGELVGELINVDRDKVGKKIIIKNYQGELKEAYIRKIHRIFTYKLPPGLIGEKVIITHRKNSEEKTQELIGELLREDYDAQGKSIIIKTSEKEISLHLRYIESIVIYTSIERMAGERVLVKLKPEYLGYEKEYDPDYFIMGKLIKQDLEKITLKTVDFDGDLYKEEDYYRDVYLKNIEKIVKDYSIPDILSLGEKSIEIEELTNKFKYSQDSLMYQLGEVSRKLSRINSSQSRFDLLSVIIKNAINTLKNYDSYKANKFKLSLDKALKIFSRIRSNLDDVAQRMLKLRNRISETVFPTNFNASSIKYKEENIDPNENISALNNILIDLFQNEKDKFLRINCAKALVDIDYLSIIDDLALVYGAERGKVPIELIMYAYEVLSTKGFPKFFDLSKEALAMDKYAHIRSKLEEIGTAHINYIEALYRRASEATMVPDIFYDLDFYEQHLLRTAAVIELGRINTPEAVNILLEVIQTKYDSTKLRRGYSNYEYRELTKELRAFAVRAVVNKKNLTEDQVRKIVAVLALIIRNLDERMRVRIDSARGIGKMAIRAKQISREKEKTFKIRPEIVPILIYSLISPNKHFRTAIIWSLGELESAESVKYINTILYGKYTSKIMKKRCLYALYKIATEDAIRVMLIYKNDKLIEEDLRDFAEDLLIKLGAIFD